MGYGWMGNYERIDRKARFVPIQGEPEVVWPARGFQPDAYGGYGVDCVTGSRYDVLARDNPAWAEVVLAAAVQAGMPLRARKIGRAGKYTFWRLCAASPAEAEADSIRLMEEHRQKERERDIAHLREFYSLTPDQALVLPDGELMFPEAAQHYGRRGYFGLKRVMVMDGQLLPLPEGAEVKDIDWREVFALTADEAVVLPDGDLILAQAVQCAGRMGYTGPVRRMLVDGEEQPMPEGAEVQTI